MPTSVVVKARPAGSALVFASGVNGHISIPTLASSRAVDLVDLQVALGPEGREFPLTHCDGDTFTFVLAPELPSFRSRVAFDVGADGIAQSLTIGEFNVGGIGTLERV